MIRRIQFLAVATLCTAVNVSFAEQNPDTLLSAAIPSYVPRPQVELLGDTASGYLMGNIGNPTTDLYYSLIIDHLGRIHYFQEIPDIRSYNLDWHPERKRFSVYLFDYSDLRYQVMDEGFELERELRINGYGNSTDNHELRLMPDGSHWIGAYRWMIYPALADSGVFPDLDEPILIEYVVQHQDSMGNVLFEWHSSDHVPLSETADWHNQFEKGSNYYDHVHGNTIEVLSDTTMLLSFRNLDSVYKIDTRTGEVIWKLGGKNNQFQQVESFVWHNAQHDVRYHPETGLLSLYDNGFYIDTPHANGRFYRLDEEAMTVELVAEFDAGTTAGSHTRGSFRQMPNGNWLIGWGDPGYHRMETVTEVDESGNAVWNLTFKRSLTESVMSYRWVPLDTMPEATRPHLAVEETDSSLVLLLSHWGRRDLTGYRIVAQTGDEQFLWSHDVTSNWVNLDTLRGEFRYRFHILSLGASGESLESNAIGYFGEVDSTPEVERGLPSRWITLNAWPNPFNASATVSLESMLNGPFTLDLYTVQGRWVRQLAGGRLRAGHHQFTLEGENLASGVYLLNANVSGNAVSKKITVMK